jgi:hypothetical protein
MYSFRFYLRFQVTAIGLGTYYRECGGTPVFFRKSEEHSAWNCLLVLDDPCDVLPYRRREAPGRQRGGVANGDCQLQGDNPRYRGLTEVESAVSV